MGRIEAAPPLRSQNDVNKAYKVNRATDYTCFAAVYVIVAPLAVHHRPLHLPRISNNLQNNSAQAMYICHVVVPMQCSVSSRMVSANVRATPYLKQLNVRQVARLVSCHFRPVPDPSL